MTSYLPGTSAAPAGVIRGGPENNISASIASDDEVQGDTAAAVR